jgi:hypothetical protein
VGPTGTSAAARALGGPYARYEEDFRAYADRHWQTEGARWEGNYYDRALIYYAWWARTGEATYWWRATQQAATYRREYLEANPADPYKPSPHWAQLEGLEKHYLLTGDETSRAAVVRVADVLNLFNPSYMTRAVGEGRIAARVVHSALLAWRLTPAGAPWPAGAEGADWGARLERHLAAVFAWQQPDGSYPADGQVCGGQLNYMVGLLNDALIKTHLYYRPAGRAPDARVEPAVRRAADYLWRTQWVAAAESFQYASVPCGMNLQGFSVGGPEPAPDLNGLLVTTFGWLSTQGADAAARAEQRARADQVFAGGVARAWLSGSKQFNEHYSSSFHDFAFARAR